MDYQWTQAGPATLSAFLASLVECIEALTIVLAVGAVRGWRGALAGAGAAMVALVVLLALLGPVVTHIPLAPVRIIVGGSALVFGLRWLRKAIGRAAGSIPLRDETRAYARETARLGGPGAPHAGWDREAMWTTFRVTMLEGIEVVFIVAAIGATKPALLLPASIGALAAWIVVALLGLALHRPIAAIPENTLKLAVGVMLCAFGTFWLGEGIKLPWPGGDLSLLGLIAGFLMAALAAVAVLRRQELGESRGK